MFPYLHNRKLLNRTRASRKRRFFWVAGLIALAIAGVIFQSRRHINLEDVVEAVSEPVPTPTEINPNFITQVNECFIPTATAYGYTLRITSAFRTLEEQDQLFEQGRTINGHIVTDAPPGRSIHNYGYAVDVVDRSKGFDIDWEKLGKIGAYCGLEQSDKGDQPHFEHRDGLTTFDFEAGKRPRLLTLPCEIMRLRYEANENLTMDDLNSCSAPQF